MTTSSATRNIGRATGVPSRHSSESTENEVRAICGGAHLADCPVRRNPHDQRVNQIYFINGPGRYLATGVDVKPPKKLDMRKVVMGLALLLPTLAGCYPSYSAKSIKTRVLDSKTKTPIQGVIVAAYWGLETQNGTAAELMVLETTTGSSRTNTHPSLRFWSNQ